MQQTYLRRLVGIVILAIVAFWLANPGNPGIHVNFGGVKIDRNFPIQEGLDLKGGIQVLLQADVPPGTTVDPQSMEAARQIVESRVNALGVSEPLIRLGQDNRIIVELPGVKNPDQAIKTFGETGLLEFVDAGTTYLPAGTVVTTTLGGPKTASGVAPPAVSSSSTPSATGAITSTQTITSTRGANGPGAGRVFPTILQGKDVASADVGFDELGRPQINFSLTPNGAKKFANYTSKNVGKYLAITMDKKVIEAPVVQSPITDGRGRITGGSGQGFTLAQAQSIVIQLRYGSLPIPLKVVESNQVGPTLGADSVHRSIVAGVIGLAIVALFMLMYYRLPGLLADLALLLYAAIAFSLFKLIPVTLTVPGIAGFILSIGMAVDANILIFERTKEELRGGRSLRSAIDLGFSRAWTSIRDSNLSTLITCAILWWFGHTFGASIIEGFAFTLAIGVFVSLFSAVFVSRTFLEVVVGSDAIRNLRWYGLEDRTLPTIAGAGGDK